MPILRYFVVVGGALLCLLFVADAWLPKPAPRKEVDLDRTTMRITGPSDGDSSRYADLFMAMPAKPAAPASGNISAETRRAFAAMPAKPQRMTVPRDVANPAPSNGFIYQRSGPDGLPTW
jgi:hypothetical protein